MNQILSVENTNKNNNSRKRSGNSKSVIKIVAICLIIVGIGIVGIGSYFVYDYAKNNLFNKENPPISTEETKKDNIKIDFSAEGNNVKVKATGEKELAYLTYRWDENEETKIEINDTDIEQKIEIPKGLHTLTVIVVDIDNISETKTQEVKGVTKPKVEIATDGSDNFIIIATDEEGLAKVEFIINETEKYLLKLDGRTELEYPYPLHDGENRVKVKVYNVNDISETAQETFTK